MELRPPHPYIDLRQVLDSPVNTMVNVIGTVVDVMAPTQTSKEKMYTFKLLDPVLHNTSLTNENVSVRFFAKNLDEFPPIQSVGDVVLLRNIKRVEFKGPLLLSSLATQAMVFPSAKIPSEEFSIAFMDRKSQLESLRTPRSQDWASPETQNYVIHLHQAMAPYVITESQSFGRIDLNKKREGEALTTRADFKKTKLGVPNSNFSNNPSVNPSVPFKKFRLIKDLQAGVFSDVLVEVVKKYDNPYGFVELFVTDYTENKRLFHYKDPEGHTDHGADLDGDPYSYTAPKREWNGPWGKTVLKVSVRDPHASYARSLVQERDFVSLTNMKMTDRQMYLEGDLWQDSMWPNKIQISVVKPVDSKSNPDLDAVMLRKDDYYAGRKKNNGRSATEADSMLQKNTKSPKKKKKRKDAVKQTEKVDDRSRSGNEAILSSAKSRSHDNNHVRCYGEMTNTSNVRGILDVKNKRHAVGDPLGQGFIIPFINAKYRAKVRVVDFSPRKLEDFAVPVLQKDQDSMDIDYDASQMYEWHFALLLEDATTPAAVKEEREKVWVQVNHENAQYLFGNKVDDPRDLRRNNKLLAQLREQLFLLWGNLEEKKDNEVLQNKPFECCIEEYGIEMDDDDPEKEASHGWKKFFGLFGTTIM